MSVRRSIFEDRFRWEDIMRSSAQRRERRQERRRARELADGIPSAIDEWIDMWFAALPYDALLVIKENGVVIGAVRKQHVDSRSGPDLYLFLKESPEYGYGDYRIAARYDGAFRGEHLHCEVGEPEQWRRGSTRAETRAIVDTERAKRERAEAYERDPVGTTFQVIAEELGAGGPEGSPKPGRIPAGALDTMARTLCDASPEDFRRCCDFLREKLPPDLAEEVFSAYRLLEAREPQRRGRVAG